MSENAISGILGGGLAFLLATVLWGVVFGERVKDLMLEIETIKETAISNDAAQFNPKTGEFEWLK